MSAYTKDTIFNGRIQIRQHATGYRFSIDAVLLAHYARPAPLDKILDLGTGCGVIPLILSYRHPETSIIGIEIQQDLASIAMTNIKENSLEERIRIFCMDMKEVSQQVTNGPVDLIVSNPPFRKTKSGRINPDSERAIARHELKATLADVMETAGRMLRTMGRLVLIYPAERLADILSLMRASRIEPKILYPIYSGKETHAKLVIVEGAKGGRTHLKISPPVYIYKDRGVYSESMQKMFEP